MAEHDGCGSHKLQAIVGLSFLLCQGGLEFRTLAGGSERVYQGLEYFRCWGGFPRPCGNSLVPQMQTQRAEHVRERRRVGIIAWWDAQDMTGSQDQLQWRVGYDTQSYETRSRTCSLRSRSRRACGWRGIRTPTNCGAGLGGGSLPGDGCAIAGSDLIPSWIESF